MLGQYVFLLLNARPNTAVSLWPSIGAMIGIQRGSWLGVALPMIISSSGQRLIMSPLTVAGVANTSGDIAGAASGVVNTVHQIGGAVGLSIVSEMVAGITSP